MGTLFAPTENEARTLIDALLAEQRDLSAVERFSSWQESQCRTPTSSYRHLVMACPKGWEALTPLAAPDRATAPLIRQPDGSFKATGWDDAMKLFVSKFKGIMKRHGSESVAFLSTGQICTEEMALLGALCKFGMGGVHCDSNTRQCMASAHVAARQSFAIDP